MRVNRVDMGSMCVSTLPCCPFTPSNHDGWEPGILGGQLQWRPVPNALDFIRLLSMGLSGGSRYMFIDKLMSRS